MAASLDVISPPPTGAPSFTGEAAQTAAPSLSSAIAYLQPSAPAPFEAIRSLFDHLRAHPSSADALNNIYPTRGIFKTAAIHNPTSDQKLTIDLSPARARLIPSDLRLSLSAHGLDEILSFFTTITANHVPDILSKLSDIASADLTPLHKAQNLNFRLCDYTPSTAAPLSDNGCGAHTDYGTFSIIFQDGQPGLEAEAPENPGTWIPVPDDATIVLCGWCALILSGGRVRAVRHRVRRVPGVRRLSAVLFVAPDVDVVLKPLKVDEGSRAFSARVMEGRVDVGWFKDVMGKRWRWREGNEVLEDGDGDAISQDGDIERLVWGSPRQQTIRRDQKVSDPHAGI